jgi:hypothetical protein
MIEWTLEILDWIRTQLWEQWPEAQLRGSAPDIHPVPYRIRFRENGIEYWLNLEPQAMRSTAVADVRSLLEKEHWIKLLKETGCVSVGVHKHELSRPVLQPCPTHSH